MNNQFKIGDVVQLKSGGPKMTILGGGSDHWVCQWFTNAGLQEGTFASASLRAAEETPKFEETSDVADEIKWVN